MSRVREEKMSKKVEETHRSEHNTPEAEVSGMDNTSVLCEQWFKTNSGSMLLAKSANSPSQTNYSDPESTPHDFTTLTSDSSQEINHHITTVHRHNDVYTGLDNYSSIGMMSTPSISIAGLDSVYSHMTNETVDFNNMVCETLNDESVLTGTDAFYIDHSEDYFYTRPELPKHHKNKITNFFKEVTSPTMMTQAEDWGIDRSIYTVYSRSGFFADCHRADQLFHGEYLTHWGMEYFAECRMALVFCIILADREVRKHEVQSSIVPLAITLLDRYMAKNKNCPSKLTKFVYSKVKNLRDEDDGQTKQENTKQQNGAPKGNTADPRKSVDKQVETKVEETPTASEKLVINSEVVYNLIAASCYFIADKYNGLANMSVKALLMQWTNTCRLFTKTRYVAHYIMKNKETAMSIVMSQMFDIYSTLDYVITTPFVSYMVQNLVITSGDLPYPQNPSVQNELLSTGHILARIALVDDTFHRFPASIITLSIYSLIRKLAYYEKVITTDEKTWLKVDETNIEIKECSNLLVKTLSTYVNTEILDALTQPIEVKNASEEIFNLIFLGEGNTFDLEGVKRLIRILSN